MGDGFAIIPNGHEEKVELDPVTGRPVSGYGLSWVISRLEVLTPTERTVIGNVLGHYPKCFPSLRTIAKETGLSRATVAAALRRGEFLGLLERRKRFTEAGDLTSNEYVPNLLFIFGFYKAQQAQIGLPSPAGGPPRPATGLPSSSNQTTPSSRWTRVVQQVDPSLSSKSAIEPVTESISESIPESKASSPASDGFSKERYGILLSPSDDYNEAVRARFDSMTDEERDFALATALENAPSEEEIHARDIRETGEIARSLQEKIAEATGRDAGSLPNLEPLNDLKNEFCEEDLYSAVDSWLEAANRKHGTTAGWLAGDLTVTNPLAMFVKQSKPYLVQAERTRYYLATQPRQPRQDDGFVEDPAASSLVQKAGAAQSNAVEGEEAARA